MNDQSFPKKRRLLKRQHFKYLVRKGKVIHSKNFLMSVCKEDFISGKFGITVTRKVGNACLRNRIKRVCREAYRIDGKSQLERYAGSLVVKKSAQLRSNHELRRELKRLFEKVTGAV